MITYDRILADLASDRMVALAPALNDAGDATSTNGEEVSR